jgi:DNA polymerase alpha subunit A
MADEQTLASGRRRSRGPEASARSSALERLKALRQGGGRRSEAGGGFQIKMETPIYDTVGEDEYDALVAKRREEARGFIVDDDGLGYGDEGEEEDWSKSGLPFSSDEESDGGEAPERPKKKKKKEAQPKKPSGSSSLSAAAAMMGKQRISSMFTSSVFFKKSKDDKAKGLVSDSIVDDVIAEFAPDETDRERRRRGQVAASSASVSKSLVPTSSVNSEGLSFGGVDLVGRRELATNGDNSVLGPEGNREAVEEKGLTEEREGRGGSESEMGEGLISESDDLGAKGGVVAEKIVNGVEMKVKPVVKEGFALNAKIEEEKDPALSAATAGWQAVRSGGNGSVGGVAKEVINGFSSEEKLDFDVDSDGLLPFYIVDAHEEFYGANMGTLYLFGKVRCE